MSQIDKLFERLSALQHQHVPQQLTKSIGRIPSHVTINDALMESLKKRRLSKPMEQADNTYDIEDRDNRR